MSRRERPDGNISTFNEVDHFVQHSDVQNVENVVSFSKMKLASTESLVSPVRIAMIQTRQLTRTAICPI